MRSAIIAGLLATATAWQLEKRDAEEDFTSAADALISSYIPDERWDALTSPIGAAASEASVTGDVSDIIFSVLKATEAPDWFSEAIPSEFSDEFSALDSAIDELRPPTPVETVVQVTTTDGDGNTITTDVTTSMFPVTTETITTETTDAEGNTVTTTDTTTRTVSPTDEGENAEETTTSEDLACMPTAMAHAAAGVAAIVGVAMAM